MSPKNISPPEIYHLNYHPILPFAETIRDSFHQVTLHCTIQRRNTSTPLAMKVKLYKCNAKISSSGAALSAWTTSLQPV